MAVAVFSGAFYDVRFYEVAPVPGDPPPPRPRRRGTPLNAYKQFKSIQDI